MEGEQLVQKNVEGEAVNAAEIRMEGNEGPLYFALVEDENGVADSSAIEDAKATVIDLYETNPEEIKALEGKDRETVKTKLIELHKASLAA